MNELAIKKGAKSYWTGEDFVISVQKLRRIIAKMKLERSVVTGHLVSQILRKREAEFVAVVRCSPDELEKRLRKRGYSSKKVKENVLSEILDVCLVEALHRFGSDRVGEFDTTGRKPADVAKAVISVYRNDSRPQVGIVDWLKAASDSGILFNYI